MLISESELVIPWQAPAAPSFHSATIFALHQTAAAVDEVAL
jgi:hypothetical protein